ncbi:MAG: methionine ABC transporter ATP-binding protein [Bacilli bacterium]
MSILEVKNLSKTFKTSQGNDFVALSDVNLSIEQGEIFGVIGLSGAGKSTLVRCMNLLEKPTSGEVLFQGRILSRIRQKELLEARSDIGMIFQSFNLLNQSTVFDNIAFPLKIKKWKKQLIADRVDQLLRLVGLEEKKNQYPPQLSGGQKQRVAIARALATSPSLLLLDEATSALDPSTTKDILSLLKTINRELGVTLVIITHQMAVIEAIADRVAIIDNSQLVEVGPVRDIFFNPKSNAAKKILVSEGTNDLPTHATYYRLIFQGEKLLQPLMASLVIETKVLVNIFYANVKTIVDATYGEMIITVSQPSEEILVEQFLHLNNINYTKEKKQ